MAVTGEPTFRESVDMMFNRAVALMDLSPGLEQKIRVCNSTYTVRFGVRLRGKIETFVGAVLTCVVAAFIIITTAAALHHHIPPIIVDDAAKTANALMPLLPHGEGELARKLFAIGLFDAGFLGALCISLSSSWAVGEVFGWAHSLNKSVKDAPWFYVIYLVMLLSSGAVVLIPHAPLVTITMFVQVVAVTLLPSALIFLLLILNDEQFMGKHVNTRWENIANWSIVIFVSLMSTLFAVSTLFPGLLDHLSRRAA
ncbi:divalent metal cation transporter MntH [mine drainage metagenome]|uniref:Divalent metal cation transporter MntH n=1 Tax=mine drainage metagenome TaxID=410659 RepID=A0A1J5P2M8_9ZZZZ